MNFQSPRRITRRHVLRGLGTSLSLPFLDAMRLRGAAQTPSSEARGRSSQEAAVEESPRRMICCYIPNGVNIQEWVPTQKGSGYSLSPTLKSLESHRDHFTILSGLGHPASTGGHSGADTWLTGADLGSVPGREYSNTVSADQVVAEFLGSKTRFPSLQLSDMSGTGSAGHSHSLSFNRTGLPLPAENSPRRLFERLFVPETSRDRAATLRRYAERRSILDNVLEDAHGLQSQLGRSDRRKVDEFMTSVRETEQRVERLQNWIDVPKPVVDAAKYQLNSQPQNAHDRHMWLNVMLELCHLTFVTDSTRVITFEWSREASGYGGGNENHHELSHHGGDSDMLRKLAGVDTFHLERLSQFLTLMNKTQEGKNSLLDQTAILYGSGMNSGAGGDHSPKNLPLLLAGGKNLGFQHDQHLQFDENNHPPLNNVLLSLIQSMGVETDQFADSTGTLSGLTS